jgi:hypothetical protein
LGGSGGVDFMGQFNFCGHRGNEGMTWDLFAYTHR